VSWTIAFIVAVSITKALVRIPSSITLPYGVR
jgi:hypothetical protein